MRIINAIAVVVFCTLNALAQLPQEFRVSNNFEDPQVLRAHYLGTEGSTRSFSINNQYFEINKAGVQRVEQVVDKYAGLIYRRNNAAGLLMEVYFRMLDTSMVYEWKLSTENSSGELTDVVDLGGAAPYPRPIAVPVGESEVYLIGADGMGVLNINNGSFVQIKEWAYPSITEAILRYNRLIISTNNGQLLGYDIENESLNVIYNNPDYHFEGVRNLGEGYMAFGHERGIDSTALILEFTDEDLAYQTYNLGTGHISDATKRSNGDFVYAKGSTYDPAPVMDISIASCDADGAVIWENELGIGDGKLLSQQGNGLFFLALLGEPNRLLYFHPNGTLSQHVNYYAPSGGVLDINNIEAAFSATGSNFLTLYVNGGGYDWTSQNNYRVPKGAATGTMSAQGIWVAGRNDSNNQLMGAAAWFRYHHDFTPGPFFNNNDAFEHVWEINASEITYFLEDWEDGVIDNDIPFSILTWPAKGNPHFRSYSTKGRNLTEPLAPFVDVDGDGNYNAYNGDYPLMKGHQMLWWVFNDDIEHQLMENDPMKIQVECSAYAYDYPSDELMYNTTFIDYKVTNKSGRTYNDLMLGLFTSPSLGCFADDAIGCVPDENTTFIYNLDETDGDDDCPDDWPNYGNQTPIQTIKFLNQSLDYFTNALLPFGGGEVPPIFGSPNNTIEYYNYMTGKWRTGTPVTYGGDGYDLNGDPTNYIFDGNPANDNEWSMCNTPLPKYFRQAISSTTIGEVTPNQSFELKTAMTTIFTEDNFCPNTDNITEFLAPLNEFTAVADIESQVNEIAVYPNPTQNELTIDVKDLEQNFMIEIYDMNGALLQRTQNQTIVDVSVLVQGIYVVRVESDGKARGVARFVKM